MKNIIVAFMLGLMLSLSGCTLFGDTKDIDFDKVVVKNVSVLNGITVEVNGVECNFTFTTDREIIFEEIKVCLIEHAKYKAGYLAAAPAPVPLMTLPSSEIETDDDLIFMDEEPVPPVDPILINEAERATLEVLEQIKQNE